VHVVSQLDTRRTVATEGSPQSKYHAANLKEAHLCIRLLRARPTEGFIKSSGTGKI
jgi:hypothetical protein